MEKRKKRRWPWLLAALALVLILLGLDYWNLLPHRTYTAEHFGIETLQSPLDADGDGIDDYTDLMLGARQDAGVIGTRGCRARPIPTSISAGSPICGCFLRDMPKA